MSKKKTEGKIKTIFASVTAEKKVTGKVLVLFLALFVAFIAAAVLILNFLQDFSVNKKTVDGDTNPDEIVTGPAETEITEEPRETVSEYVLNAETIDPTAYDQTIEAEETEGNWCLTEADYRPGYSGSGYLTDFDVDAGNSLFFRFDIPAAQHYDISVCFASDDIVRNEVCLNGEQLFDFECTEETVGRFVVKTYYGVFFEPGETTLTVHEIEGGIDLDYLRIRNNQSIYSSRTDISPSLINPNASAEAKELMKYLTSNFGKRILTGQYVSDWRDIELEKIYENTLNYPAIRFGDMSPYSVNAAKPVPPEEDDVQSAVKWAEKGGIVGYIWHWKAPLYENEFYSEKTDFDLALAVTDIDVALLSPEKIDELYQEGSLTAETVLLIHDIDNVSAQLARLKDKHIPVLWRPLHEASGDWFWWGSAGADSYKWLWNLLYRRQTEYHRLDNLIWIWSAQGTDYFVGNAAFDIASVDLYSDNTDNTSYYKQYQWIYSLTGGQKLIALSECGTLPDMELTFRDRAVWSFFGLWYGDYLLDKNGDLSEKYNTREDLVKMYNSNRTITLDKYKNKSVFKEETPVTSVPVTTAPAAVTVTVTEAVTTVPEEDDGDYDDDEDDDEEYYDDYDDDDGYYEDEWE
ncbi:glycosyl hydrolase [Ruminococcus sp. HUN007]|uniref:glycosyl hydrolase n=1 Tax=Ruminococcus sp. HUN007 TaxID=1514668 RepID=UPI000679683F|nr:glycosyl hydrolase [Ruminococcus sp. HUN007]